MKLVEYFTHYPSRLLWVGGGVLLAFSCLSGLLLIPIADEPHFPLLLHRKKEKESDQPLSSFCLSQELDQSEYNWAGLKNQLQISFQLSRPDRPADPVAVVYLKGGKQQRVDLPGRVYLIHSSPDSVQVTQEKGPFWLDLSIKEDGSLSVIGTIVWGERIEQHSFVQMTKEPPLQTADLFALGTPFRVLGEAKWWGEDALSRLSSGSSAQIVELGGGTVYLQEQDWVVWREGAWCKGGAADLPGAIIARIRALYPERMEWDVWDESGAFYARLATPLQHVLMHARPKWEEWFNSVRIRSEKQISCILEKQCLILRVGDWVLKEKGRWRVLRKQEEKQHILLGKLLGDLLVLDQIDPKQANVKGRLFLANRIQIVPIEIAAMHIKRERAPMRARKGV